MEVQEIKLVNRYQFWKQFLAQKSQENIESWDSLTRGDADCNGCDGCGSAYSSE